MRGLPDEIDGKRALPVAHANGGSLDSDLCQPGTDNCHLYVIADPSKAIDDPRNDLPERKVLAMTDQLPTGLPATSDQKTWRIMGLDKSRREFLVVMGTSRQDCVDRLGEAIDEYSHADLGEVDSIWLEEWIYDDFFGYHLWVPQEELPLRRLRLRAAAIEQHALRRSA